MATETIRLITLEDGEPACTLYEDSDLDLSMTKWIQTVLDRHTKHNNKCIRLAEGHGLVDWKIASKIKKGR